MYDQLGRANSEEPQGLTVTRAITFCTYIHTCRAVCLDSRVLSINIYTIGLTCPLAYINFHIRN